jgi:hypothetical protein
MGHEQQVANYGPHPLGFRPMIHGLECLRELEQLSVGLAQRKFDGLGLLSPSHGLKLQRLNLRQTYGASLPCLAGAALADLPDRIEDRSIHPLHHCHRTIAQFRAFGLAAADLLDFALDVFDGADGEL